MRILIHGLNFAPELIGVGKYTGEMAHWLAARGHEVRAVTAPPFNPEWKVASGYSAWRYRRERYLYRSVGAQTRTLSAAAAMGGGAASSRSISFAFETGCPDPRDINTDNNQSDNNQSPPTNPACAGSLTVLRCPLWVPPHPSAIKRVLHLASFALTGFPAMLGQVSWRPDVVIAIEPTLLCAPAALIAAKLGRAKAWLHVQDFEADAGFQLGLLQSPALRSAVGWLEKKSMSACDRVSTISEKMLAQLESKRVRPSARFLFPNWVDTKKIFPSKRPSPLRAELGIAAGEIVALYSGTMARKQGLEGLAQVAGLLAERPGLRFVFCGDGPGRPMLAELTAHLGHVQWIPLQPFERLNDLLNLADIHLLPQKAGAADLVMPSKLTGMFASGRPVVATSAQDTQLAQTVQGRGIKGGGIEGRGIVVEPDDPAAFAEAITALADSPSLRESLGRNAREYAVSELGKEIILAKFERELSLLAASSPS